MPRKKNAPTGDAATQLRPHVATIQQWCDENMSPHKGTPAAIVHEALKDVVDLPQSVFVNGFRALIKTEEIVGIQGFRRAGYKKVGEGIEDEASPADIIYEHIDSLQEWCDKHLTETKSATGSEIYAEFADEIPVSKQDFTAAFSILVREGKISGIRGYRGLGYKRPSSNDGAVSGHVDDDASGAIIQVTDKFRIHHPDRYNWVCEQKVGDGWATRGYFGSLRGAAEKVSRLLVEDVPEGKTSLKEMITHLDSIESKLSRNIFDNAPLEMTA